MIRLQSPAEAVALRVRIPELSIERMMQFEGEDGLYDIHTFSIFEGVVEFKAKERQGRFVLAASVRQVGKGSDMLKIISCSVLLLIFVMANGLSLADTFKCTRPDGSVFFTDDPSQVPRGCVIERVKNPTPVEKVPDTQQPPSPSAGIATAPQTQPDEMKSFESFKSEAALLVEKAQSARHDIARSSFVADEMKAMRELADIKVQKNGLLNEIKQSSLKRSEKEELERLLSLIGE